MRFEDYKTLAFERRGKVLTIIINRPESYNSVNGDLHDELATVFSDVADDPDSDVIVLTGAGKSFCAGGDMEWFQSMIDNAAEKGRDVASLQAALDAYEAALVASRPAYEALGQTFETHSGFDANGKVTDLEQAQATVKEVREQAKALKESMGGTFKALREAVKAFRESNKPTQETSLGSDT